MRIVLKVSATTNTAMENVREIADPHSRRGCQPPIIPPTAHGHGWSRFQPDTSLDFSIPLLQSRNSTASGASDG